MAGMKDLIASSRIWLALRRDATSFCTGVVSQAEQDYRAGDYVSAANRFVFVTQTIEQGYALPDALAALSYSRAGESLAAMRPNPDPALAERLLGEGIRRHTAIGTDTGRIADLHIVRGHTLIDADRPADALGAFRLAETARPDDNARLSGVADALQRIGNLSEAAAAWQSFLTLLDRQPEQDHRASRVYALERLGLLLVEANRYEEAAEALEEAVQQGAVPQASHAENRLYVLARLVQVNGVLGRLEKAKAAAEAWQRLRAEVGPQHTAPREEAQLLASLAWAHVQSRGAKEALPIFERAVALTDAAGHSDPSLLYRYAVALTEAGSLAEAGTICRRALAALDAPRSTTATLIYGQLARLLIAEKRFDAGIFFHKMNLALRTALVEAGAAPGMLRAIEESNEQLFSELGNALVGRGRLAEAEQVGRVLEQIELANFIGRSFAFDPRGVVLTFTTAEDEWRRQLDAHLSVARQKGGLGAWVNTLVDADPLDGATHFDAIAWAGEDPPAGVWVIKTLTSGEALHVVLCAGSHRSFIWPEIKPAEVAERLFLLRKAMADPAADIASHTGPFYHILGLSLLDQKRRRGVDTDDNSGAAELRKLDIAAPTMIAFDLDGPLRYLPIAALWDGSGWLIERVAVMRIGREIRAAEAPAAGREVGGQRIANAGGASVAAFGTTQSHHGLPALPGVSEEIAAIVGEQGAFPGVALIDQSFTRSSLGSQLSRYPLAHVATHFEFHATAPDHSGLLLGDGSVLSLGDLWGEKYDFTNVRLATLSACETGLASWDSKLGTNLATVVRMLGAETVAATLWRVGDQAAAQVMGHFYRALAARASPVEALRRAQLALMGKPSLAWDDPAPSSPAAEGRWSAPFNWSAIVLVGDIAATRRPVVGIHDPS